MKPTEYFSLFSHNIPVKGEDKSVIYNLQKSNLIFIPNSLYELLASFRSTPVLAVKELIDESDRNIFEDYLDFLDKNQLGFFTENIHEYPELSKEWKTPNTILNAVIEYDDLSTNYDLNKVLDELDELMCFHLEIRAKNVGIEYLNELAAHLSDKVFRSICLIVDYQESLEELLDAFFETNEKFESIIIYNTPREIISEKFPERINYVQNDIIAFLQDIDFPLDHYVLNIKYFTEALQFHPYYNKKACITKNGEIKNCLRHEESFGNINESTISSILDTTDFKDLWHAAPDKVIDYQNDELRYCKFYTQKLEKISNDLYQVVK
jgi:SPASM domain peptide maturase of grasp-with-spasm system